MCSVRFARLLPTLVLGVVAAVVTSHAASRPNVLFIVIDDLRPQLGCYGDTVAFTPNLDRLAARGTVFERAYAQQAVCNASRQSVLSGRRPDTLRVWDLKTVFRDTSPDVVSLPEHFKRNGYFTLAYGKIYHDGLPDPKSWSVPAQFEAITKRENYRLPENRVLHKGQKMAATEFVDEPADAYPDGKVAAGAMAALEILASESNRPFFLAVGIRKPHLPFTAPKKYWDLYEKRKIPPVARASAPPGAPAIALHDGVELRGYADQPKSGSWTQQQIETLRRGYYAAISFADAQIGRVLDTLDRTGLAKNTVVVVWGDHGFHLGENGLWTKTTNYEADTRVPLIVATPDQKACGVSTRALVELLDIYPTLIELCALPETPGLEGRSFAPNLGNALQPGRDFVLSQFPRPWLAGERLIHPHYMGFAVRDETHRYVEWRDLQQARVVARELYTYKDDQHFESANLADDPAYRGSMERLSKLLPASPKPER